MAYKTSNWTILNTLNIIKQCDKYFYSLSHMSEIQLELKTSIQNIKIIIPCGSSGITNLNSGCLSDVYFVVWNCFVWYI